MNWEEIIAYIRDSLGNTVVLPIVIALLGIALGLKWSRAIRSGLVIGVAFVGLGLVISLLIGALAPATNAFIERFDLRLTTIDVGWPVAAAIAFGTTIGALVVPLAIGVNVLMLLTRLTKTLNVDIWNFWHYAFTGSLVYLVTGENLAAGLLAAAFHAVISLVIADVTAPAVQKFFKLPGISIPQGWAVTSVPLAIAGNWVLDRIPVVRDIKADADTIQRRFGVAGDPLILGVVLGIAFGVVAGYEFAGILVLGVQVGAVMLLIPRIIAIFMEGLVPVSEAARAFFQKRFAGREFYVGLDSAILIGHPITIAAAILLIPTTLVLAAVLPGNTTLPLADLAATAFFVAMATVVTRGNLFRTYLIGTGIMVMVLYLTSFFAPTVTQTATNIGYELPPEAVGAAQISALSGGNLFAFFAYAASDWMGIVGPALLVVGAVVVAFFLRNYQYEGPAPVTAAPAPRTDVPQSPTGQVPSAPGAAA